MDGVQEYARGVEYARVIWDAKIIEERPQVLYAHTRQRSGVQTDNRFVDNPVIYFLSKAQGFILYLNWCESIMRFKPCQLCLVQHCGQVNHVNDKHCLTVGFQQSDQVLENLHSLRAPTKR